MCYATDSRTAAQPCEARTHREDASARHASHLVSCLHRHRLSAAPPAPTCDGSRLSRLAVGSRLMPHATATAAEQRSSPLSALLAAASRLTRQGARTQEIQMHHRHPPSTQTHSTHNTSHQHTNTPSSLAHSPLHPFTLHQASPTEPLTPRQPTMPRLRPLSPTAHASRPERRTHTRTPAPSLHALHPPSPLAGEPRPCLLRFPRSRQEAPSWAVRCSIQRRCRLSISCITATSGNRRNTRVS